MLEKSIVDNRRLLERRRWAIEINDLGRFALKTSTSVVDFHTHFYPSEVFEDPKRFAAQQKEEHWLALVCPEGKRSLQGWANPEKMLADMDDAGVDKSVLLGWYWENADTCELQNAWYLDLVSRYSDRFSAFVSIQPVSESKTSDQLKFAVDNGFEGIGEMHPGVQGFGLRDRCWTRVVEFAIENGLLINLHVTEPVGRPYEPRENTNFREVQWLVEEYPEMRLILSHWGGLVFMHELNPYIRKRWKNVYYDVSASPLLYSNDVFQSALSVIDSHKILFGSDYPLLVYPRKQKEAEMKSFVESVRQSVSIEDAQRILAENAADLLDGGDEY